MSVPLLHSKTCLLAVLYVPFGHHGPPFSSDEPLRRESHLYDMPTTRPSGLSYEPETDPTFDT
jgi:hypothetical protein